MALALGLIFPSVQLNATSPEPPTRQIGLVFVAPVTQPDYDKEVLQPLHAQQKQQADLEALQAAQAAQAEELATEQAASVPAAPVQVIQAVYTQPDDYYKAFIYNHESGNDPTRWNSSGCLGLGQACPASKLLVDCPTMDYACEDNWFTNYMLGRYGSWQAAYYWWIRTDCRPYCGNWW